MHSIFHRLALCALTVVLALPLLGLLGYALRPDAESAQVLRAMASTVLWDYTRTSALLCLGVGLGSLTLGTVTACAVSLFEFRGRRVLEWALLLPLAMPAYVLAYAYTDFLQYAGPLQSGLRALLGLKGPVVPDIRSLGGAMVVMSLALYPYVYLLVRAALVGRATPLMEAARLLGASLSRRVVTVALPLARPALAAGLALVLMETLADFGVVSYFGVQSFSAGIYKAWLGQDNPAAAAQLAMLLLVVVAVLLSCEQQAQTRRRFTGGLGGRRDAEAKPLQLDGAREGMAMAVCAAPVLMGFALPLVVMLWPVLQSPGDVGVDLSRLAQWALNSLTLSFSACALTVALALVFAHAARTGSDPVIAGLARFVGLGYAVPGAVIVVGLLAPVGALQATWPGLGVGGWVTATALGLMWAYAIRFTAVALQSVQAGYARIGRSLDDSSKLLGAGPWAQFSRVHWPLLKRPVLAGALLVFVDVMKELPATLVLRPFNSDTLAVMAFQLARDERLAQAALPSLAIVLAGLGPVWLLSRALGR